MSGTNYEQKITDEDIMYKDEDVCILKPEIKKGIIIFSNHKSLKNINITGLKTGKKLHEEGISFDRSIFHPYIFFRAPYFNNNLDGVLRGWDTHELVRSYGNLNTENKAFIRVDPHTTYTYSSEIRDIFKFPQNYRKVENIIKNSRKTLTDYLNIIKQNEKIHVDEKKYKILYNLFSSKATIFPINAKPPFPFDEYNINKQSEILVRIPHLTPDYFVDCSDIIM